MAVESPPVLVWHLVYPVDLLVTLTLPTIHRLTWSGRFSGVMSIVSSMEATSVLRLKWFISQKDGRGREQSVPDCVWQFSG